MRFKLKCLLCPATCWIDGEVEYDTNAVNLDESGKYEWEPEGGTCEHSDWEIVDEDFRDSEDLYT